MRWMICLCLAFTVSPTWAASKKSAPKGLADFEKLLPLTFVDDDQASWATVLKKKGQVTLKAADGVDAKCLEASGYWKIDGSDLLVTKTVNKKCDATTGEALAADPQTTTVKYKLSYRDNKVLISGVAPEKRVWRKPLE